MSLNYAYTFSLLLLLLVILNINFFYSLNTIKKPVHNLPLLRHEPANSIISEIYEHLNYLLPQFKNKNGKFFSHQRNLVSSFNSSVSPEKDIWDYTAKWSSEESLFPHRDGRPGQLLQAIRSAPIVLADNAPKGTQLKILMLLEGKQKLFFKPKRYNLDEEIHGNIYAGFDRHNSEVFAYYMAMVMNFTWVAPATMRRVHVQADILPVATIGLKKTMLRTRNNEGSICIYGKCFYCKVNETVCGDQDGFLEGAAILYLDQQFRVHKSPWRRSYTSKKMDWEKDNEFCKKISTTLSKKRLLNLIEVAIFDFLIQNGDRHRYEVYKDKIVILDNGKGLGNPNVDELDILAPLYQCCMLQLSTWQYLELLSGGNLTDTVKLLAALAGDHVATEAHFKAVERRLLKVYATVQYCIGKYGSAKVFNLSYENGANMHMKQHGRARLWQCCGARYAEYGEYYAHRRDAHGDARAHRCLACGYSYKTKVQLDKHLERCESAARLRAAGAGASNEESSKSVETQEAASAQTDLQDLSSEGLLAIHSNWTLKFYTFNL